MRTNWKWRAKCTFSEVIYHKFETKLVSDSV